MTEENEGHDKEEPKEMSRLSASVLWELHSKKDQDPGQDAAPDTIPDQKAPWIAVHGSKSAVILQGQNTVELVDVSDAKETRNADQKTIAMQEKVLAIAFSACGGYLAIADAAGTLSLYKSDGRLLFGHRVVRAGGSDSVVSVEFATSEERVSSSDPQELVVVTLSGVLLRLGELRLAEFEQVQRDRPNDALCVIMRNIRFERTSVGRLKENARSCILAHHFHEEECIILGNRGGFMSVWTTSLRDQVKRSAIENLSVCDSKSEYVDAMAFDANYKWVVALSEGKLSWWNWREMTVAFEIDITGVLSFAVLQASPSEEQELELISLVAVARLPGDRSSARSLEVVQVSHPEPGDVASAFVVSKLQSSENFWPQSADVDVALFASRSGTNQLQTIAAYRTYRGVSALLVTGDNDTSTSDASDSDGGVIALDGDAVTIAESLADAPLSSLLHKSFQAKIDLCTGSIGDNDDDSRVILKHLLRIAGAIREYTSSPSRSPSLPADLIQWCDVISGISYKWTTFQLLRSSSSNEAAVSGQNLREKWDLVQRMTVVDLLEKYMKIGSMRAVMILWGRHLDDDVVCHVGKLLRYLPASLPVSAYADWIRNEVMATLIHHVEKLQPSQSDDTAKHDTRSLLTELALWLLERSEAAAAKGDLDTAIRICNLLESEEGNDDSVNSTDFSFYELKLQTSASHSTSPLDDGLAKDTPKEPDAFECIDRFRQKLRHVKRLAEEHHFIISLSVFEEETPATIAMSMLDRVLAPESLTKEINLHVKKYLQFCEVDVDAVLCDYISELAESIQTSQSAEENRALVLLDEISDVNIRADATLALLRSALPPYSPALKIYTHNCARSWKTGRLEEIQEHVRLMEIQDMLTAYDIKRFDIADTKTASRMVSNILSQISRPTAFTDAMLLVDAYSDLHCDRALVKFRENLLADSASDDSTEVETRVANAVNALAEVKKRKDPKSNAMLIVSLMEEITEFGVMLLEMEADDLDASYDANNEELSSVDKPPSFVLRMLEALVASYLPEFKTIVELAGAIQKDSLAAYVESSLFLLSDALLVDLRRLRRVEADYGVLLSVSALRDPEKCESKLKELMSPQTSFADDLKNASDRNSSVADAAVTFVGKGKGKKRAVGLSKTSSVPTKRQRTRKNLDLQSWNGACHGQQQDDNKTRLIFDLNRFASAVGIESKRCKALIAQSAAQSGSILLAVRFCREFFSQRASTGFNDGASLSLKVSWSDATATFHPADAFKKIAIALSLYTSTHVKEIYDVPFARNQPLDPALSARTQAPMYTLELLKYALCMCDEDSFDETLIILENTMLVNEVLQLTQHDIMAAKPGGAQWTLYPRWYRGDSCVLPSYEAMKLATRFAIAERTNLRREVDARDTIASKRYVSFLVMQRADLLSLQVFLSMQELPEDAAVVVNVQMGKLLSIVFQSLEVDNYLALGLMLSMEQKDAFHAFRRQISRENVAKDFNRFQQLAFVGADAARAWQQIAFLHQCVELEGNARWWHYLNLLGIECDHKAFQSERRDLEYIRRLVPTLITRSNYDFYTVLEFSRHYQIDDNFPSLVYAETLLLEESATANLEYQDKIAGVIEEIHEQHLKKMLLKAIPRVSGQDYDRLLFIFRVLLEHTSYHNREEVERRVEVLRNLKVFAAFQADNYMKTGESKWATTEKTTFTEFERGDKVIAEKISFHQVITKPREVLARLVTKENFSALIELAEPLQLEPDELQMMLLKNMITKKLNHKTAAEGGDRMSSPIEFSAFEEILRCLNDTECRVTAAEWLAENFPLGEEKLKALEFALNAAVSGGNDGGDVSNTSFTGHEALTRLETKVLRVKLELLFQNASAQASSLAEIINDKKQTDQLLALVSEPTKLFLELYRRYALWFYTHSCDNLHTVADSIAGLLQVPHAKLRLELVREWLVKDAVQVGRGSVNEEGKEDPFELLEVEKLQRADEDFAKRIMYMASFGVKRSDSFGDIVSYLVEFARDSRPLAGVTFRAKMRALSVILRLGQLYHGAVKRYVTTQYGIESSDVFFKELLEHTKYYTHMMTFEERRVPYEMVFVMKTEKEVLTRSFLRRFSLNQPWVLRCASQLLLDFEIEAPDLWEGILSNMLKLGMVRSLAKILGPLSRKSFVRSLECGRQVWEEVLTLPMIQLKDKHCKYPMIIRDNNDVNSSSEEINEEVDGLLFVGIPVSNVRSVLAQMVSLLQRCPFLDQIDVPAFVIHLRDLTEMAEGDPNGAAVIRQMDLYGFAVKCAMIIPKPVARFEALERIIRAGAFGSVLHELLDTSCFLDGEQAMENDTGNLADNFRLIQESFSEAAKREDYSAILDTLFEQGFVEYLAATADIDYLLSLLLEDKRMETALNAVELYYEYHPTATPSLVGSKPCDEDVTQTSDNKHWELIDTYLASSNSAHLERFKVA